MRALPSPAPITQREPNVKHLAPAVGYEWFACPRTGAKAAGLPG
jgi:hypothetical protein